MKQMEVQIMGTSYVLGVPEGSEDVLLSAVQTVDSQMCKIRDNGKTRARERVAVLAALNIAKDLAEARRQLELHNSSQVTIATVADQHGHAAHTPNAVGAAGASATSAPAAGAVDPEKWQSLVRRLDMALESDDRLL